MIEVHSFFFRIQKVWLFCTRNRRSEWCFEFCRSFKILFLKIHDVERCCRFAFQLFLNPTDMLWQILFVNRQRVSSRRQTHQYVTKYNIHAQNGFPFRDVGRGYKIEGGVGWSSNTYFCSVSLKQGYLPDMQVTWLLCTNVNCNLTFTKVNLVLLVGVVVYSYLFTSPSRLKAHWYFMEQFLFDSPPWE